MKKIIITLFLSIVLISCNSNENEVGNTIINDTNNKEQKNINKNIDDKLSDQATIINKDYEKFNKDNGTKKDNISNELKLDEPVIKTGYDNKDVNSNLLSKIEENINNKEKEENKLAKEKENKIKSIIGNYFDDINSDKTIINYIASESIEKITKSTKLVYSLFSDIEKKSFLEELHSFGYKENSFDPNKEEDINKYINFVVKGGFKVNGGIKEVVYNRLQISNNFTVADIEIKYYKEKSKEIKVYLNENNKILINN